MHAASGDADPPTAETGTSVWDRFGAHEPFYFLLGMNPTDAKIQFSLRYRIIGRDADMPGELAWLKKFHIGYTQRSFWDLAGESSPFQDNTFNPELIYITQIREDRADGGWPAIDLQAGISHESNGQAGPDSRSLNQIYAAPEFRWGGNDGFQVTLTPRAWFYTGDLSDNPDIAEYRGHMSLSTRLGWTDGVLATALGQWGNDWDKGSLEVDVSYPVNRVIGAGLGFYLHAQLFTGYGENLLRYDEKMTRLRFGISLVR